MFSLINTSPQSAELKLYIAYYPHFCTTINVYRHAAIELKDSGRRIQYDETAPFRSVVTCNIDRFLEAEINGPCEVIRVGFKPLGLNYFIDEAFAQLFPKESSFLITFGIFHRPQWRACLPLRARKKQFNY